MISRINRIVVVFAIVAISLYLVVMNREPTTIHIGSAAHVTANTGVVLISVFALGIVCTGIVALFFGIKGYFRERSFLSRDRQRQYFYDSMLRARSYLAAADWPKARYEWEKLVSKDPTNIVARVELSRSIEGTGDLREALRVIDEARTASPNNIEVLFRAAELNIALGNRTAAIDNLALIMSHQPCRRAATLARDLSEELNRIDDALEYQASLERLAPDNEAYAQIISRLEYKRICLAVGEDEAALKAQLRVFIKKHPNSIVALEKLSALEKAAGKLDDAAQLLVRAAKVSRNSKSWMDAARIWIEAQLPERALAAGRSAAKETRGQLRIEAELNLVRMYLTLNMADEARVALDSIYNLAASQGVPITRELRMEISSLKGQAFGNLGEYRAAAELWREVTGEGAISNRHEPVFHSNGEAPAPRLSTP